MNTLASLFRTPEHVSLKDRKFYLLGFIGYFCGLVFHATYMTAFLILGLNTLFLFNLLSLGVFLFNLIVIRRDLGLYPLTNTLSIVEIVVHQALCIAWIGWDAGFQYWILLMMVPIFFLPGRNFLKFAQVLFCFGAFVALDFVFLGASPARLLPPAVVRVFGIANVGLTCLVIVVWARYFTSALVQSEEKIEKEHAKAERLLHNILPVAVADRLKDDDRIIADGFPGVTVLFADLVDFTPLSSSIPPEELVEMLNGVFSAFDALTEKHGLEKIKTIGDAYMAASGIPVARPDHAEAGADFALDLLRTLDNFNRERGLHLRVRIGMHSGPVVAGVIGKRKFSYDLWGDTVNVASRMESHGEAGRIQATEAVHERLRDKYVFEERGSVLVKGRGELRTWFLVGERDGMPPIDSNAAPESVTPW